MQERKGRATGDAPAFTGFVRRFERFPVGGPAGTANEYDAPRLRLLGKWEVHVRERAVELPLSVTRLLALVALGGPLPRDRVAGTLRPNSSQEAASAGLRTALWKLGDLRSTLLLVSRTTIGLASVVATDVAELRSAVTAVCDERRTDVDPSLLAVDLLPDWDEPWVSVERERLRLLRLHALEALAEQLTSLGRYAAALEAGMLAVQADPLRESAHRVVIAAHVAEGNLAEAIRQLEFFRSELMSSLGVHPSPLLAQLAESVQVSLPGRGS